MEQNAKENQNIVITPNTSTSLPLIIANITLIGFLLSFSFMIYQTKHQKLSVQTEHRTINTSAFNHIALQAQSVFVWDVARQQAIYSKDASEPRPLASLTKIMTAITALSILPKNATVTVKKEFLAEEGDSGLYVDEKWNFKKLLDFSLVVSSNDGMRSIASVAGAYAISSTTSNPNYDIGLSDFIQKMNTFAGQIGLSTLHFKNETGLDEPDGTNGGVGSAQDVAKLMEYALKNYPDVLEATKDSTETISSFEKTHIAVNTDTALPSIPNIIASKTGTTALAGGNLVIAFDAGVGRPIIISVLGSTLDGRFTDVEALASSTLAYIAENQ